MCWDPSFVVIPEVIVLLEAGGFELTLWSTLAMTCGFRSKAATYSDLMAASVPT